MKRLLAPAWPLCAALLLGCSPPRPPEPGAGAARERTGSALRQLAALSPLVATGVVERVRDEDGSRLFEVAVEEVLGQDPAAIDPATHPSTRQARLLVGEFVFGGEGGQGRACGQLDELSRYVFFLTPAEAPGRWVNLADPARYSLPEARDAVEELRALPPRRAAPPAQDE